MPYKSAGITLTEYVKNITRKSYVYIFNYKARLLSRLADSMFFLVNQISCSFYRFSVRNVRVGRI